MNSKNSLGIYVHIPFCVKKCNYCDFLSAPATKQVRKSYIEALIGQIEAYKGFLSESHYEVKTIYFGGGTPSLLDVEEIGAVFAAIKKVFGLLDTNLEAMEITLEANPGTFGKDKLLAYREMGFNRISMGVQSMNNEELKLLGRVHTVEDFLDNYQLARECGFENINIDLMQSLPGQTLEAWEHTLKQVIALNPEHISAYSLIIEEGTKFYEWYAEKEELLPDEETERAIYYRTEEILKEAGYERYEISNYAKEGKESRHNLSYWQGVDYLGIGLGASSLIKGERFSNTDELSVFIESTKVLKDSLAECEKILSDEDLIDWIIQINHQNGTIKERNPLTKQEQMEEFMFLGLRVMKGVSKKAFEQQFEISIDEVYGEVLHKLAKEELLLIDGDNIKLTRKGIDVSNYVFAEFLID